MYDFTLGIVIPSGEIPRVGNGIVSRSIRDAKAIRCLVIAILECWRMFSGILALIPVRFGQLFIAIGI